ncbi:MFS transporter [Streptomyces sp. NPDC004539]|uniref:MDR family MFS transporter n=1 Tax=Streptomyces sp. NPDC004539 TaxID=3154280 RepID=UPI00339FC6AF
MRELCGGPSAAPREKPSRTYRRELHGVCFRTWQSCPPALLYLLHLRWRPRVSTRFQGHVKSVSNAELIVARRHSTEYFKDAKISPMSVLKTPRDGRSSRTSEIIRTRFGGFPKSFWILWSGTLINRFGTMVHPFLALYLTADRGLTATEVGYVLAVLGVGGVFSQPLGGVIADRWGRRVALTGGTVSTGLAMLALGYAQHTAAIVALAFLLGLVTDLFRPASQAIVADLVPAEERPRAFGLLLWAVNLGFSLSMALGGALARDGFQILFWIDALTCAGFGALVWFGVPEEEGRTARKAEGRGADILRDRVMIAFILIVLLCAFVFMQALTTLPLAMRQDGLPTSSYGFVMALNGLTIVVLQPLLGHRLGRLDRTHGLVLGMLLMGAGNAATAWVSTTPGYAGAVVLWTVGEVLLTSIGAALVADLAPAHLRGRYNGWYGMAWGVGAFTAPLGGTRLLEIGAPVLWYACGALCALAAAGQWMLGGAIRSRSAVHAEA